MSFAKFLLTALVLWLSSAMTRGQGVISPCPEQFFYAQDGGRWIGRMSIPADVRESDMVVKVQLSLPAALPSAYYGKLELEGTLKEVMEDIENNLPVRYRILFPLTSPLPQLTQILVNDKETCNGPPATGSGYVTSLVLEYKVTFSPQTSFQYQQQNNYHYSEVVKPATAISSQMTYGTYHVSTNTTYKFETKYNFTTVNSKVH